MRTENELMNLILQIADSIEVEAIALSGSRTNPQSSKDEFQDYDVVYIVDDLEDLISDLSWLDQFGKRIIEQEVTLGHRRLYLMLFEDGNRIDLTLCPKEHIQEWVDSEANFEVIKDDKGLFEAYQLIPSAIGPLRLLKRNLQHPAMNFGGYRLMLSRPFEEISLSMRPITSMAFVSKNFSRS